MLQKVNFKDLNLVICGTGRIDETQPIDLVECTTGYCPTLNRPIPVMPIPGKIRFSRKIADTVYDVTGCFDLEGKQTMLQQLKDLLLSHPMEETQI